MNNSEKKGVAKTDDYTTAWQEMQAEKNNLPTVDLEVAGADLKEAEEMERKTMPQEKESIEKSREGWEKERSEAEEEMAKILAKGRINGGMVDNISVGFVESRLEQCDFEIRAHELMMEIMGQKNLSESDEKLAMEVLDLLSGMSVEDAQKYLDEAGITAEDIKLYQGSPGKIRSSRLKPVVMAAVMFTMLFALAGEVEGKLNLSTLKSLENLNGFSFEDVESGFNTIANLKSRNLDVDIGGAPINFEIEKDGKQFYFRKEEVVMNVVSQTEEGDPDNKLQVKADAENYVFIISIIYGEKAFSIDTAEYDHDIFQSGVGGGEGKRRFKKLMKELEGDVQQALKSVDLELKNGQLVKRNNRDLSVSSSEETGHPSAPAPGSYYATDDIVPQYNLRDLDNTSNIYFLEAGTKIIIPAGVLLRKGADGRFYLLVKTIARPTGIWIPWIDSNILQEERKKRL